MERCCRVGRGYYWCEVQILEYSKETLSRPWIIKLIIDGAHLFGGEIEMASFFMGDLLIFNGPLGTNDVLCGYFQYDSRLALKIF